MIFRNLRKTYNSRTVIDIGSLEISDGHVNLICGPSGVGKTTLLRLMMGLEMNDDGSSSCPENIRKSCVFQEDRLCLNISPYLNIYLAVGDSVPEKTIREELKAAGLAGFEDRPARELSGGMRRRVSLLRALLFESDILYLDEPFKGLDEDTKNIMIEMMKRYTKNRTVVLVTHDESEAERLGSVRTVRL